MNIKPDRTNSASKSKKKRPPKKITATYLHNAGLYYLQRFAASKKQFYDVMNRKIIKSCKHHKDQNKEECQELLRELIEKFEQSGLLNDDIYTQGVIYSMRNQGKSQRAIHAKLAQKGIASETTQEKLEEYNDHNDIAHKDAEYQAALKHAKRKKLGPFRTKPDHQPEKELASLARAGFSYDIAQKVLNTENQELP